MFYSNRSTRCTFSAFQIALRERSSHGLTCSLISGSISLTAKSISTSIAEGAQTFQFTSTASSLPTMITLRKERIICLGIFIIVTIILSTMKIDFLGSDNMIWQYEPPLRAPPKEAAEKVVVTPPAAKTTTTTTAPPDINGGSASNEETEEKPPAIGRFTTIPDGSHVEGFTLVDNLYLRNGTFYVVTSDVSKFPPVRNMISLPLKLELDVNLEPTDEQLQFLSAEDVESALGKHAIRVEGLTVIVYDPTQFLSHFYHWWGEIILGAWRIISFEGSKTKEILTPKRFLLPFSVKGEFRDPAGINAPLMRAAFPHASIEESDYWNDHITLNATVVFDRVMLISRPSAHRHPWADRWTKMIAGTMNITVTKDFWAPIRQSLVQNTLGYVPEAWREGRTVHGVKEPTPKPLVTYISRQDVRRRLATDDHEALVKALADLEVEGICEFREVRMEQLSLREQIELAARSMIFVGVHGNGLTHELWMPPSDRSTVIEIFHPEGYSFDYELLARNMGHRHYAIWNDTIITYPDGKYHDGVNHNEHFHGNDIPVHGPTVAKIVRERLAGKSP
ncbi:hypothetical protein D9615_004897 [Tricholomella constricta]|uniref:Glycosyltransferase 61 catalytic domain-containing protein n=1 Tax=Tricholomella constricta TaxID=117010 RepID=A0A8H5HH89_9AGAR|nr:hypothetical protein D9615_004897 [Tricholomella constricta]